MTGWYRAGMAGMMFWLLAPVAAPAQKADTVQTSEAVDTTMVADSTQASDSAPVILRTLADSVMINLKSDKAYAYANDSSYWRWYDYRPSSRTGSGHPPRSQQEPSATTRFLTGKTFEYIVLTILGAFLLYAIVRIIVSNRLQLFYRAPRRLKDAQTDEEALAEDGLEGKLMHFIQTKDYRQAVRYLYLKTLRVLNDKGMIRYNPESTNEEYRQQLSGVPQGVPFRDLTTIYEKVWYGEFPLGETLFNRLHQYFEDFYKSIRV